MTITVNWAPLLAVVIASASGFIPVIWYLAKMSTQVASMSTQLAAVPDKLETLKTELRGDIHSLAKDVRATSKTVTDERLQTAEFKARLQIVESESDNFVRKATQ